MIPADTLVSFFAASVLLGLAPGPDNLFVLTQSALHGRGAGLTVTFGLCTGLLAHTLAVTLGIAVLLQASAVAFTALKLLGAAYLLYLAWQAFRAPAGTIGEGEPASVPLGRLYRRGIVMNVTNPKVSLFFLAFLPQFADPGRGPLPPQLILLGGVFIVATIAVFGTIALLAGSLGRLFRESPAIRRGLNRLTGILFIGLALALAVTQR